MEYNSPLPSLERAGGKGEDKMRTPTLAYWQAGAPSPIRGCVVAG
jgi:hypothetical protein